MSKLTILQAGPFSTVQDNGRHGCQHLGVPISGALDRDALLIGNHLVGNNAKSSAIEICFGGFRARVSASITIAIVGSTEACIKHYDDKGTVKEYVSGQVITIDKDEEIEIPPFKDTLSVLLCVSGGIDVPLIYGSYATTSNAQIGGHEGRRLENGDKLTIGKCASSPPNPNYVVPRDLFHKTDRLRIILGPQDHWFTPETLANLVKEPYKISPQTSRMGMRLSGQPLKHKGAADIISDAMTRGILQVPADGQPIIAMADHGTMGGYTKIACVISADLSMLGRLRPNDSITFEVVTSQEAGQASREKHARLQSIIKEIHQ